MPFKDALELVCDYLGAGMAYQKENFTYKNEYEWWKAKSSKPIAMHPQTKMFVDLMLKQMADCDNNSILRKKHAKRMYQIAERKIKQEMNS